MKALLLIIFALISINIYSQSFDSSSPEKWNDFIGKKYNGNDSDLNGFKLTQPKVSCDSLFQRCAVVWDNSRERTIPNCKSSCNEQLKEYEIHFEVVDRKGKKIANKKIKWNVDILSPKEGYVGAYKRFIEFGEVSFSYSTINYWVQNIKWSKPKIKESVSDGRKAFTIAEQLKNIKEQEEREMAERLEEIKNRKKSDE